MAFSQQEVVMTIDEFQVLEVKNGIELTLIPTEGKQTLIVEGENASSVRIQNTDNTLTIFTEKFRRKTSTKLKVTLKFSSKIYELDASNNSKIVLVEGVIKQNNLEIRANGSSKIELNLDVPYLTVALSSKADMYLQGTSKCLDLEVKSKSIFQGYLLETEHTKVYASGDAMAKVKVSNFLDAIVKSGSIFYQGAPKEVKKTTKSGLSTGTIIEVR